MSCDQTKKHKLSCTAAVNLTFQSYNRIDSSVRKQLD